MKLFGYHGGKKNGELKKKMPSVIMKMKCPVEWGNLIFEMSRLL
jgi:hypothetical protein